MTRRFSAVFAAGLAVAGLASVTMAGQWRWVVSTDAKCWDERPPVEAKAAAVPKTAEPAVPPSTQPYPPPELEARPPLTVVVDPTSVGQKFDGWGGCFNELGWRALLRLDEPQRQRVLKSLFDPTDGLGLNFGRLPIGASDFALSPYSLDDTPGDLELAHFSIDRDRYMLIPFVKAALAVRPDLTLFASPWSPPAWMKTNGTYHGGTMRQEPAVLKAYATYLARFVEDYKAEGINIAQVHVQNEPFVDNKYPTCPWPDPATLRDFIRDYAAPAFAERHSPAKLWFGTITNSDYGWFKTVLDDPKVRGAIGGVGVQYESRKVVGQLHADYPDLPLMQTETKCFNGHNDWPDAEDTFDWMQQFIRGGVSAYAYWNLVLDQTGLSSWAWSQDSTIVVDAYDGHVTYTPQYFLMKHLSAFVKPGSTFLKPTVQADPVLAFKTAAGVVTVVCNRSDYDRTLELHVGGDAATVTLPAHSFDTFVSP